VGTLYKDRYIEVYVVDGRVTMHAADDGYTVAAWPEETVTRSLLHALAAVVDWQEL
jgi:hypothetical protein